MGKISIAASHRLGSDDPIMASSLLLKVVFTVFFCDFQPCTVHDMSLSKHLSREEAQSLRGLLRRAQEIGVLSEFINPITRAFRLGRIRPCGRADIYE